MAMARSDSAGALFSGPIVVLADKDKEEMDDIVSIWTVSYWASWAFRVVLGGLDLCRYLHTPSSCPGCACQAHLCSARQTARQGRLGWSR